jgi:hypothetical protein
MVPMLLLHLSNVPRFVAGLDRISHLASKATARMSLKKHYAPNTVIGPNIKRGAT